MNGFCARARIFHTRARFRYANIKQCHLVNVICWNLIMVGWQIQSVLHEQSTFPLGRHTQWCIKPLCSYGTFNTGLKHQRSLYKPTACSCKHIWNLPANLIFGTFQKTFLSKFLTKWHCATVTHAAVHSIPVQWMKLTFPILHLKRDTNTGGAEVPLSWNNISWNTRNLLYPSELQKNKI